MLVQPYSKTKCFSPTMKTSQIANNLCSKSLRSSVIITFLCASFTLIVHFAAFQMSPNHCSWRLTKSTTLLALPHQSSTSTTLSRCVQALFLCLFCRNCSCPVLSCPDTHMGVNILYRPSRRMSLEPWTCLDLQRELELGQCLSHWSIVPVSWQKWKPY